MRFIVELYRLLVLALLAIGLIAASYLVSRILMSPEASAGTSGLAIVAVVTAAAFLILAIGITATFISIHDRIEELSQSVQTLVAQHEEPVSRDDPAESAVD